MFNTPNYSYNYNYPWYNQTALATAAAQAQPQVPSNGINWVQGESGAKSYPIAPNQSILLMDSESNTFYLKSSDQSGMPMPLRIFDYTERVAQPKNEPVNAQPAPDYITRQEFEKRLKELSNAKQHIPTAKQ